MRDYRTVPGTRVLLQTADPCRKMAPARPGASLSEAAAAAPAPQGSVASDDNDGSLMKDVITQLLLFVLAGVEAVLWIHNPLHIPGNFVTARALGVQMFEELGASMEPSVPRGRRVLVSAWSYWRRAPRVGDVIAFVYPPDPAKADLKRIVAAGGSRVAIRDGVVYVNGHPGRDAQVDSPRFMPELRIPINSYFVLGDNRAQSTDSRSYGLIPRDHIIGKQWL